jgi:LPXTG-motif cell wall-anchored protein
LPPITRPWALLPWTLGPSTSVPTTTLPSATTAVGSFGTTQTTGDPGQLPATGGSDATAFFAIIMLGVGVFLLFVGRKYLLVDDE